MFHLVPKLLLAGTWERESLHVDIRTLACDNHFMKTVDQFVIPPAIMADLQEAADQAAKGVRDAEQVGKACEEMDRIREEIRQKHGILDIGVPAIRELRDSE
jgi:hypothetical protein